MVQILNLNRRQFLVAGEAEKDCGDGQLIKSSLLKVLKSRGPLTSFLIDQEDNPGLFLEGNQCPWPRDQEQHSPKSTRHLYNISNVKIILGKPIIPQTVHLHRNSIQTVIISVSFPLTSLTAHVLIFKFNLIHLNYPNWPCVLSTKYIIFVYFHIWIRSSNSNS